MMSFELFRLLKLKKKYTLYIYIFILFSPKYIMCDKLHHFMKTKSNALSFPNSKKVPIYCWVGKVFKSPHGEAKPHELALYGDFLNHSFRVSIPSGTGYSPYCA